MKAQCIKPIAGLKLGETYPYVDTVGSNIQVEVDGYVMGFSDTYLLLIDENSSRRAELATERDELTMEISRLRLRLDEVKTQIEEIDSGCTNQTRMAL